MNRNRNTVLGHLSLPSEADFTNSDRQREDWVRFSTRLDLSSAIVTDTLKMVVTHDRKEVK